MLFPRYARFGFTFLFILTNPPKGDRSGGGAGLGLGGVKEKLCQKRVEEKSRTEVRLDLESSLGGCSSRLNSTRNPLNALSRSNPAKQKMDISGQNRRKAGGIKFASAFRAMFRNQANPINNEDRILPLLRARTGRLK